MEWGLTVPFWVGIVGAGGNEHRIYDNPVWLSGRSGGVDSFRNRVESGACDMGATGLSVLYDSIA